MEVDGFVRPRAGVGKRGAFPDREAANINSVPSYLT